MQTFSFRCELPNGIHARPANALEQQIANFQSEITLFNKSKSRQANAKSVLALVGADVTMGDECYFQIEGADETIAYDELKLFIEQEFMHCDSPIVHEQATEQQVLPIFLSRSTSPILRGKGVSKGIAKGQVVFIRSPDLQHLAQAESDGSLIQQSAALKNALHLAREKLRLDIQSVEGEIANILEAQSQLLDDEDVEACLLGQNQARNEVEALAMAIEELSLPFRESSSEYLRQRELDIKDLGLRIAINLSIKDMIQLPELKENSIVVCQGLLTPGQLLTLQSHYLQGVVMAQGAEKSHTVILAQTNAIPLLCASGDVIETLKNAHSLLLDSRYDALVVEPDTRAENWLTIEKEKQSCLLLLNEQNDPDISVLTPSLVLLDKTMMSKDDVIKALTDNLEINGRTDSGSQVESAIWQREEIFSTALGFSIAIPHCKSLAVKHSSISVLRLSEELAWGDNVDVKLIIMLTINGNEENQHMRIFSSLARKLMHESFREQIMTAESPTTVVTLLKEELEL
ncbi:fructose PTS transporter subunit IIA [Providencia burhodogranariea]|uniref:Mulitfunctional phosphoenolpyruvate-protein phosphotransferase/phosphocarrier protein HPr/PTS system fructose-like transporter subunit IIA n=1 Tax=Providencia burhodogranariea DSM 19968 TaxID=1141662 RepID=K8X1B4_9GAMM|nr:fructose PTS transporter subunit IIA [Providencia burhodogranariea]EKT62265.1 mulitfunctional phosphoenolpyruvate-protein phosphotransferase/phosphocarrier protein HPr/PTS system fructose-like transporter subunit IIA [Providencia burhodogranariea DSM 19968]